MPETVDLSDADFTAQMEGLVKQANQVLDERAASSQPADTETAATKENEERALKAYQSLPQMLKPFVNGLEAITRVTGENAQLLGKLDAATSGAIEPLNQLPALVAELQGLIERKDALSRQMFDALHEELRSYKDDFLLDSVHRPIIRDLITLYDDLSDTHRQLGGCLEDSVSSVPEESAARFGALETRMSHNLEFILEVLARFEVVQMPLGSGKLNKQTQRAIWVEPAEEEAQDLDLVKILRRGFLWKNRVVRPEEVVIRKWKEGLVLDLPVD